MGSLYYLYKFNSFWYLIKGEKEAGFTLFNIIILSGVSVTLAIPAIAFLILLERGSGTFLNTLYILNLVLFY